MMPSKKDKEFKLPVLPTGLKLKFLVANDDQGNKNNSNKKKKKKKRKSPTNEDSSDKPESSNEEHKTKEENPQEYEGSQHEEQTIKLPSLTGSQHEEHKKKVKHAKQTDSHHEEHSRKSTPKHTMQTESYFEEYSRKSLPEPSKQTESHHEEHKRKGTAKHHRQTDSHHEEHKRKGQAKHHKQTGPHHDESKRKEKHSNTQIRIIHEDHDEHDEHKAHKKKEKHKKQSDSHHLTDKKHHKKKHKKHHSRSRTPRKVGSFNCSDDEISYFTDSDPFDHVITRPESLNSVDSHYGSRLDIRKSRLGEDYNEDDYDDDDWSRPATPKVSIFSDASDAHSACSSRHHSGHSRRRSMKELIMITGASDPSMMGLEKKLSAMLGDKRSQLGYERSQLGYGLRSDQSASPRWSTHTVSALPTPSASTHSAASSIQKLAYELSGVEVRYNRSSSGGLMSDFEDDRSRQSHFQQDFMMDQEEEAEEPADEEPVSAAVSWRKKKSAIFKALRTVARVNMALATIARPLDHQRKANKPSFEVKSADYNYLVFDKNSYKVSMNKTNATTKD